MGWSMRVEAVFLDMGGTLAHGVLDAWRVLIAICRENGVAVTREAIDGSRARVGDVLRSRQFLTEELLEVYPARRHALMLEELGVRANEASAIAEEAQGFVRAHGGSCLYEEVPQVLSDLRARGLYMGILSNTACNLEQRCRQLGIWGYFDLILASDLLLSYKPHPLMFRLAASEAGVAAKACLHVGDSYGADYLGARRAGMEALLLDRAGSARESCDKISDLTGVLEYLDHYDYDGDSC